MAITAISSGTTGKSDYLPDPLLEAGVISKTSEAYNCFVGQSFSAKLQAYMISYAISVTSAYSVYK